MFFAAAVFVIIIAGRLVLPPSQLIGKPNIGLAIPVFTAVPMVATLFTVHPMTVDRRFIGKSKVGVVTSNANPVLPMFSAAFTILFAVRLMAAYTRLIGKAKIGFPSSIPVFSAAQVFAVLFAARLLSAFRRSIGEPKVVIVSKRINANAVILMFSVIPAPTISRSQG
jgi:hypothetical protein